MNASDFLSSYNQEDITYNMSSFSYPDHSDFLLDSILENSNLLNHMNLFNTSQSNNIVSTSPFMHSPLTNNAKTFPSNGSFLNDSFSNIDPLNSNMTTPTITSNFTKIFKYHDTSYRIVGTIIMTIIFIVGVVGNSMVILVVLKSKNMRSPTNCYLVSLAFADLLLLLSATLPTIVEFHLIQDVFVAGAIACRAMVFSQYLGFNLSSLSITALTAERYVAICKPMKAHVLCTINRAKKIIAALWLFGFCYSAPWLGLITTKKKYENFEQCYFILSRDQYMMYYLTDLVVMYLIPVVVNVILYFFISKTLYQNNPVAVAFGGGSGNTFGVVAATASLCRSDGSCDNSSKFGSYKSSSINSSFQSHKNSENRSLIRKKFANESIKSFTLSRHESKGKKNAESLRKKFWKRESSTFVRGKDSFDSNRICEGVEEEESNSGVKEDKEKEAVESIQMKRMKDEKSITFQEPNKSDIEVAGGSVEVQIELEDDEPALKKQLKRQSTLFHETLNQQDDTEADNNQEATVQVEAQNTKADNSKSSFKLRSSPTTTPTTVQTAAATTNTTSSSSQASTISPRNTSSHLRRGRYNPGNSVGFSLKRKTTKASLLSGNDTKSSVHSKGRGINFMASSLSTASTYGTNPIQSRTQIIKMLVVVVSLFAVLWFPYRAYVLYNSFLRVRFEDIWLMLACRTMVHVNSAINPILYNVMSAKFKKAFKNLLTCGRNHTSKAPARRGAVDCNLNYSRKDVFFNMYEKNYRELIHDRAKSIKE